MTQIHLAAALDGAGWHPAAWREAGADAGGLFTLRHWARVVARAEAGLLDLVTFEDALAPQSDAPSVPDARTDRVRGRLDAVLLASALAPLTTRIGLVPTAVVTHTEPFHLAKAVATLDHVSRGRAGVRVRVSADPAEAANVGRRDDLVSRRPGAPSDPVLVEDLFSEAADWVEVQRRLWDSWEDDAEIRDVASGRFINRDKLHYVDFVGSRFSVKGPLITQRPPQGQPVVAALAHVPVAYDLVATSADVGFVTPADDADVSRIVGEVGRRAAAAGRSPLVLGDLLVVLGETAAAARSRLDRLDERAGSPLTSDARIVVGTPADLADLLVHWHGLGLDGFRLRPATHAYDLPLIADEVTAELRRRGVFRDAYEATTLRGLLGLQRPENRYARTA